MSESENVLPVEVEADRETPTKSTVTARGFELVIDEPEDMGGQDDGPNPLEYLLAGQAGCLNVTASQVAKDMDLALEDLEIEISGEFDVATFQTERPDDHTGVRNIEVRMDIEADADRETLEEFGERVEKRCPVSNNIAEATDIGLSVERS
ncbi:OsmC family protein [Halopiger aswanensis]|uniref:Putative OsmC-like protein n=1 Tax=Halopiger aswanensis TaxID=148449 RepID=A0A3R7GSX3_9EURY|nr:OsmC family protein [Halopiger aswanensis]RKD88061.1 putative OsmC-like protein [Halopiger aswanensis]